MILTTSNKLKQVLWINYVGDIVPDDFKHSREDLAALLAELQPGFRLMVNLSHVDTMGIECRAALGSNMEMISHAGVSRVVRIIPDPSKDIGFNILAFFHYHNHPQVVTCTHLKEGLEKLLA